MAKLTIDERITSVLDMSIPMTAVTSDASLKDDLGFDSLEIVEITMELEKEFHISIRDEDAEKWQTVKDVTAYIESHYPETANKS